MNAVMYLRISSTSQSDGDGFPRQAESVQQYADARQITIVNCFYEVFTGTRDDRPAFLAMLNYCAEHGVDRILIERMDRWARKFSAGERLVEECRQRELTVINCATGENLTDDEPDPDMWFIGALSLLMAEWDKRKVVHRTGKARARIRKELGKCEGRKGYLDLPQFQQAIERARELRAQRMTYRGIASVMNSESLPTMTGTPWSGGSVHKMLTNERA